MRSRVLALRAAAAAGVAVIFVAGPVRGATAARADDGVTATVSQVAVAGQGRVRIKVEGCRSGRATVSSSAFARVATLTGTGSRGAMYGDVSIKSVTAAGSYGISVSCDGRDHGTAGRFEVAAGGHHDLATPHAPVRAGGGGTADRTAAAGRTPAATASAKQSGPGTLYTVAGLVLAAVAAVAVAYRSSQRRRAAAAAASADRDAG